METEEIILLILVVVLLAMVIGFFCWKCPTAAIIGGLAALRPRKGGVVESDIPINFANNEEAIATLKEIKNPRSEESRKIAIKFVRNHITHYLERPGLTEEMKKNLIDKLMDNTVKYISSETFHDDMIPQFVKDYLMLPMDGKGPFDKLETIFISSPPTPPPTAPITAPSLLPNERKGILEYKLKDLTKVKNEIQKKRNENVETRQKHETYLKEIEDAITAKENELTQAPKKERTQLNKDIEKLRKNEYDEKTRLLTLNNNITGEDKQISRLTKEETQLNEEIRSLSPNEPNDLQDALEEKLTSERDQLVAINTEVTDLKETLAKTQSDYESKVKELEECHQKLEDLQQDYDCFEESLNRLKSDSRSKSPICFFRTKRNEAITNLFEELGNLITERQYLERERKTSKDDNEAITKKTQELELELTNLKQEKQTELESLKVQITQLQEQLQSSNNRIQQLETERIQQVSVLNQKLAAIQEEHKEKLTAMIRILTDNNLVSDLGENINLEEFRKSVKANLQRLLQERETKVAKSIESLKSADIPAWKEDIERLEKQQNELQLVRNELASLKLKNKEQESTIEQQKKELEAIRGILKSDSATLASMMGEFTKENINVSGLMKAIRVREQQLTDTLKQNLNKELQKLEDKQKKLEGNEAELKEEKAKLEQDLESLTNKNKELDTQLKEEKAKLEENMKSLTAIEKQKKEAEEKLMQITEQSKTTESQFIQEKAKLEETIKFLTEQNTAIQTQNKELEKKLTELETKYKEESKNLEALTQQTKEQSSTIETLKTQLEAIRGILNSDEGLEERLSKLDSSLSSDKLVKALKAREEEIRSKLKEELEKEHARVVNDLQAKATGIDSELAALRKQKEEFKQEKNKAIAELEAKHKQAIAYIEASKNKIRDQLKAEIDTLTEQNKKNIEEKEKNTAELEAKNTQAIADLEAKHKQTIAELEASKNKIGDELKAEIDTLKQEKEKTIEEKNKAIAELEAKHKQATADLEAITQQTKEQSSTIETLKTQLEAIRGILNSDEGLEERLSKLDSSLSSDKLVKALKAREEEIRSKLKEELEKEHARVVNDLQAKATGIDSELAALRKQKEEFKQEKNKAIAELEAKHKQAIAYIEASKNKIRDQLKAEIDTLTEQNKKNIEEKEKNTAELEAKNTQAIADLEAKHKQTIAELEASKNKIGDELKAEIDTLKQEKEKTIEEKNKAIAELEAKHKQATADLEAKHTQAIADLAKAGILDFNIDKFRSHLSKAIEREPEEVYIHSPLPTWKDFIIRGV